MTYRVAVVTTSRADYGIWRPVMQALLNDDRFVPGWIVTGSHLLAHHGKTIDRIREDGAPIWQAFSCFDEDAIQDASQTALAMARAVEGTARWMQDIEPDVVMVLGDRFEMFAVASALIPFKVPIVHLHGGEVTLGAIDETFRHALTKMSHLHMTSTEPYRRRVVQMGEAPWRVHAVGAPALDGILASMKDSINLDHLMLPSGDFALVTFHPETQREDGDMPMLEAMLKALTSSPLDIIITAPNADPKGDDVRRRLDQFVEAQGKRARMVESFGVPTYYHVMKRATCMVGNSSSGILEAASLGLPVINLGDRQLGRIRGQNVMDISCPDVEAIEAALSCALDSEYQQRLQDMNNPYGDGCASRRILDAMATGLMHPQLMRKQFEDMEVDDAD